MNRLDQRIDIRRRLQAHGGRQLTVAQLGAPDDWEGALRRAIAETRGARTLWFSADDAKMFVQSFAIFFTATMMFLI